MILDGGGDGRARWPGTAATVEPSTAEPPVTTAVVLAWMALDEPWSEPVLARARQALPPAHGADAMRYRRWQDRQARLGGRLLLRAILRAAGYDDALDAMTWSPAGRPSIPGRGDFSLSHTDGVVICAWVPRGRVGIDVEAGRRDLVLDDLLPWMSAAERRAIAGSAAPVDTALAFWTAKEAICKAEGRGIASGAPLPDCATAPVSFGDGSWRVRTRRVGRHVLSLARPAGDVLICHPLRLNRRDGSPPSASLHPLDLL